MNEKKIQAEMGSEEFNENLYSGGIKFFLGDLPNYAAVLNEIALPIATEKPNLAAKYLKVFVQIMIMISERSDDKYTPEVRSFVTELLAVNQKQIDDFLSLANFQLPDLKKLLPLIKGYEKFRRQMLDSAQKIK